jgi:hypothetical protein
MKEIDATPTTKDLEVVLELEDQQRKGPAFDPPRITLGQPVVIALTKDLLLGDPEALASLDAQPDQVFHLLRLACTFHPREGEPINQAFFRVQCQPAGKAIAWSMLPQQKADIDKTSTKYKVGGDLKLKGLVPTIGVSAGGEKTTTGRQVWPYVQAKNLQQSDPAWQFKRTPGREVSGSYPLGLVVRSPAKGPASGTISLRCEVTHTKWNLYTYELPAKVQAELAFPIHA